MDGRSCRDREEDTALSYFGEEIRLLLERGLR
jgi:hypothetical protein